MNNEKKYFLQSLYPPLIFVVSMWIIWFLEWSTGYDFGFLGIYPLKLSGLTGIITGPLIHSGINHLVSNTLPLLILGTALFYFYREIAYKTFVLIYLLTGITVWLGAREAYHIGASGIVYGLASFLFFSGILRKDVKLMAITLFVAFLYGGMVWGIFPEMFPGKNISWESHLWGMITGIVLAVFFRKEGPQRKKYDWEDEYDEEDINEMLDEMIEKSKIDGKDPDNIRIKYFYRDGKSD